MNFNGAMKGPIFSKKMRLIQTTKIFSEPILGEGLPIIVAPK